MSSPVRLEWCLVSIPFGPVPIDQAFGKRLGHDLAAPDGRRALRKGRILTSEDVALLRSLGRSVVYVAEAGPDDIDEDEAALRMARAVLGEGLVLTDALAGRISLKAKAPGILRTDPARVRRINEIEGVALATLPGDSAVRAGQTVAALKVIPFALSEAAVRAGEAAGAEGGPLLRLDLILARKVALVLSGPAAARERVLGGFEEPLRARIEALGSTVRAAEYVSLEEETGEAGLAEVLRRHVDAAAELIILAGETAIMDRHDLVPRAVRRAGGEVACFGAPVDPGNLLLVARIGTTAVLGLPGCAKSPQRNVVDLVLPRVLAGERLDRRAIAALGHGGLCEDAADRPMPRNPGDRPAD
jgi:molybdenum cofactor cytidylyltransferase